MPPTDPEVRFFRFVDKMEHLPPEMDRCWIWTGYTDRKLYGIFYPGPADGRRQVKAHRWSYEHHHRPIPHGWQVDHVCRNTSCVNPDHLQAVTDSENQRRKRHARQLALDLEAEAKGYV